MTEKDTVAADDDDNSDETVLWALCDAVSDCEFVAEEKGVGVVEPLRVTRAEAVTEEVALVDSQLLVVADAIAVKAAEGEIELVPLTVRDTASVLVTEAVCVATGVKELITLVEYIAVID